ncbi:MAG: 2OG-Fe(II) oxygenase family protein [Halioglobus sp.]
MVDTVAIPLVDMAGPEQETSKALAAACTDWGFFQVTNHDVSAELLQSALTVSSAFFNQPSENKQTLSRTKENPWGYYDRELTKNLRDRKEIFDVGHVGSVLWPNTQPHFETVTRAFSAAVHTLSVRLSVLIAQALELSMQPVLTLGADHTSFTRLNYYPVEDALAHSATPPAGPFGISHHTDAGILTVLLQDAVSGLQMQHQGEWIDVPPQPNTLTINLGDMFQVWANDRVTAPLHRVLESKTKERFSIAYFLNPGAKSVIAPLLESGAQEQARYNAFRWAQFRDKRALGDYGDYGEEIQISHYQRKR